MPPHVPRRHGYRSGEYPVPAMVTACSAQARMPFNLSGRPNPVPFNVPDRPGPNAFAPRQTPARMLLTAPDRPGLDAAREGSSLIDHPYKKKPLEAALPLSRKGRRPAGKGVAAGPSLTPQPAKKREPPQVGRLGHPSLRRLPRKGSPHRRGGIERFSLSIQSDLSACTFSMPGGKADLTIRSNTQEAYHGYAIKARSRFHRLCPLRHLPRLLFLAGHVSPITHNRPEARHAHAINDVFYRHRRHALMQPLRIHEVITRVA